MDSKKKVAKFAIKKIEEILRDSKEPVIGLGSGTTIREFIKLIPDSSLAAATFLSSSYDSSLMAGSLGVRITDISSVSSSPDFYIDGADSILVSQKACIKGHGGALLREKVLAYSSKSFFILVDPSKLERTCFVPIEVVPFSSGSVLRKIASLGLSAFLRESPGKLGPVITDNGNFLVDIQPNDSYFSSLKGFHDQLKTIPGVVETGIFTRDCKVLYAEESKLKEIDL